MRFPAVLILILFSPFCWPDQDNASRFCANKFAAKLVSLQGKLFFDPNSKGQWQEAHLDDELCEGSRVRVETYSRASLLLSNGIVLRLDEGTVLSLKGIAPDEPTLLDLIGGFIHFISRTPRRLEITSPIANAGPEGTEFAMHVEDSKASLWVYEGKVRFYNDTGSLKLAPGQGAQAHTNQAPNAQIDIKPNDAIKWALYYPPIVPYPDETAPVSGVIRSAIERYRHGHVDEALLQLDKIPSVNQTTYFYKVRAAIRLTAGRVTSALQDIEKISAHNGEDADALALLSIVALTQNKKNQAYQLATQAVSTDPHSATTFSALSYAEQSRFDIDKALVAAEKATKLAPHDAMVWARKAELELSKGLSSESKSAAKRALGLDAGLERTQTVTGFAALQRMDADGAKQAFEQAVQLDSTSPLARLGLGLAKIRKGDLEEGRQDLEIAAILDPANSLIRSYLGKAYYEERRSALAEEQFTLAKERDPKDPTPFFYDAINKQTTNRPVEALHDMQKAVELNDNRAVSRSKLLLDEDAAARSANLARIYNDLGFSRVALKQAWQSLRYDSTNPSAHRFLSNAYVGQPRFRVARASELLQAQLLQPINITPVQPQLTGENIGILNSTGPGTLSLNEYDPLFNANGAHVVLNGAYGSNNTLTDNAIISGIYNNFSGSLGQFHFQTDGFRQNDGYNQDIYDAFVQYAITPNFSIQLELKSDDVRSGDVPLRLNNFHQENLKKTIEHDIIRVGGHYRIESRQDIIASGFYTTRKDVDTNNGPLAFAFEESRTESEASGYQTELQYIFHPHRFNITVGVGYLNLETSRNQISTQYFPINGTRVELCVFLPSLCRSEQSISDTNYVNGYVYSHQFLLPELTTILGFSYDSYDDSETQREQFNPKFGVIWNPVKNLTVRSAVFRTLTRPLASNQTIEPTEIAGFNQFFDAINGTTMWEGGFGIDYNPFYSIYLGGEVTWRDGKQPFTENGLQVDQARNEASHLAYFYWTPYEWVSLRSEYRYEKTRRDFTLRLSDPTNPRSIETHQVPLSIYLYHDSGLFTTLSGTYVNQHVANVTDSSNPAFSLINQTEDFWTFDAAVGFRLPKKIGIVSFEIRNLFDNTYNYQSTFDASGPQLTPFVPEQQLFGKLSLFF